MKAGDTLTVTLRNKLPVAGFDTSSLHNQYRSLDVTNIHTHGLHILGEAPGDSIFTEVAAGESFTYTYKVRDRVSSNPNPNPNPNPNLTLTLTLPYP